MPNKQTESTKKYQQRIGLVAKSFKINKNLASDFKETCERLNLSQAKVISDFMKDFIAANETQEEEQ